jgi:hypothetical protein
MTGIFASAATDAACPASQRQLTPGSAALSVPGAPVNLMFSVNRDPPFVVSLGWATTPNSGDQPTSYVIEAGSTPGASNIIVFDTGTSGQGFMATSVPAGSYYVRVRSRNAAGISGPSNEVTIVVGTGGPGPCTTAPGMPTGLSASVSGTSVTLMWSAPAGGCPLATYGVEAGSTSGASNLASVSTNSTATSFAASNVPAGTYFVRVRAGNGSGFGSPSNEVVATVGSSTPSPSSVTGRWVGVAPDGIVPERGTDSCEWDLQLDLTQSGTAVMGTATTKLRNVTGCSGPIGLVETATLISGTVGSGTISFRVRGGFSDGITDFSGTFTATRMSGTVGGSGVGSFAVNRQ